MHGTRVRREIKSGSTAREHPIQDQRRDEAGNGGRGQEQAHEPQVGGVELDRHVVAEVQQHHVAHDREQKQGADGGGAPEEEERAGERLHEAGEHRVRAGRTP